MPVEESRELAAAGRMSTILEVLVMGIWEVLGRLWLALGHTGCN
jgi:hypothetical protein